MDENAGLFCSISLSMYGNLLLDVIERKDFGKYQSQIVNCCKELKHRLFGEEKSESSQDAEGEGSRKKMKL
ncbi:hypothetical protein PROFUN_05388 [Planoprotostelium fungivorum]|uniref:Uncharacterized protein n=1 Tax=Planoprotostelium fungivorum TaxID=1890364 RepID=A0A2P6NQL1_9EUKA|nr:hypothetical protein PROFUN_05388 [Planoprotostelium fungivorum]